MKKISTKVSNKEEKIDDKTLLGNACIAKFMGTYENLEQRWYYGCIFAKNFRYHSDWNWIMPVVEKINTRDWVTIYNDECKIHALIHGEFETIDIIKEGQPLIKSVFEAVVKYAEWYLLNVR